MNLLFFLSLHMVGIATMAGTTLVDFFCYSRFWKLYPSGKEKAATLLPVLSAFRFLFAGGFLLLLISGVGMVALSHGLFAEQRWFRIKMGIIVLILINGAVYGRRVATKLRNTIDADIAGVDVTAARTALKARLRVVHMLQLLLFLAIFVLSVYKFN